MALDIERGIRAKLLELPTDHPDRAFLEAQSRVFSAFNLTKEISDEPETDLGLEWTRQARKLAKLFAEPLRMTPEEYVASLPPFVEQPLGYEVAHLTVPLIVETRVSWGRQLQLADIPDCISERTTSFALKVDNDPTKFVTPSLPYTTWAQDGTILIDEWAESVRRRLSRDQRGGTIFDGIAYHIARPIQDGHGFELIGSSLPENDVPVLSNVSGIMLTEVISGPEKYVPGGGYANLVCGMATG